MKHFKLLLFFLFISGIISAKELNVSSLTVDHKVNPVGIEPKAPRFSWKITGDGNNIKQSSYFIRLATDNKFPSSKILWQTAWKESDASVLIPYSGPELKTGTRYFWQVRVRDNSGTESKWSEPAYLETGILPSEWKA